MESSSESDSPLWNDGADSSERGATGAPNRSSSACGALKRHKVSIVMTLVASVVFYLLGAGPAGRAALKLKLRGVRWGSQNMEDVTLMKMFFSKMKTPGTFVEMGALDGVIFSNSIAYEETYGWSGVLIEANPVSCEKLFKEPRRARSTKFCSAVCDDAKKRFLEFEFVDDPAVGGAVEALKTMDAEWKESWHSAGAAKKRSMVPCAPLSMLLRSTGVTAIDLFYFGSSSSGKALPLLDSSSLDSSSPDSPSSESASASASPSASSSLPSRCCCCCFCFFLFFFVFVFFVCSDFDFFDFDASPSLARFAARDAPARSVTPTRRKSTRISKLWIGSGLWKLCMGLNSIAEAATAR